MKLEHVLNSVTIITINCDILAFKASAGMQNNAIRNVIRSSTNTGYL
jgi:hypothetical protein